MTFQQKAVENSQSRLHMNVMLCVCMCAFVLVHMYMCVCTCVGTELNGTAMLWLCYAQNKAAMRI